MKYFVPVIIVSLSCVLSPSVATADSSVKKPTVKKLRKEAKKLRKEGQALAKKARYDEALALYAKALETYEAYPMVYNEIGVIHFLQGELVKASTAFRKALSLYPDLSVAWANLAEVDRKRERFNDSALNYKEFVARRPSVADGFYGLALALMAQDKKAGALWAMKRFVALEKRADPQKIAEVQARVTALEKEGVQAQDILRIDEAIAAVKKRRLEAKAKKKERVKAHKGDQYYAAEQYLAALSAYKLQLKKRKKKTKDPSLHYKIGATYAALRDYRAAMTWWGLALSMAPKRAIIFEHLVLAAVQAAKNGQLDLGDPGSAEERQEKAAEALANGQPALALSWLVDPQNDKATYLRGRAALAGGNLLLAKKCFESLNAAHGQDEEIAVALAQTLYRMNKAKDAEGVLAKVPSLKEFDEQSLLLREAATPSSIFSSDPSKGTQEPKAQPKDAAESVNQDSENSTQDPELNGNQKGGESGTVDSTVKPTSTQAPSEDVQPSSPDGVVAPTEKKAEPSVAPIKPKTKVKKAKKPKKKRASKPKKRRKAVKAKSKKAPKKAKRSKKKKKKRKKKAALEDDDL